MTNRWPVFALCVAVALASGCTFDRSGLVMPSVCGSCTEGDTLCQADLLMICAECGAWEISRDCGALGGWCVETSGDATCDSQSCLDPCGPSGGVRCGGDLRSLERCAPDGEGCLIWTPESSCTSEEQCVEVTGEASALCVDCHLCDQGATQCAAGGGAILEWCVATGLAGCTHWAEENCGSGFLCVDPGTGAPPTCASCATCAAGPATCATSGLAIERCEVDGVTGCSEPLSFDCSSGFTCAPGAETEQCALDAVWGQSAVGSTAYPMVPLGNTATGSGPVLGHYLVADRYTTTVPLTALQFRTYGENGGSVKISLYDHDAANNLPGNRLFPEVTGNLTQNAWTTITLPARTFLPPGTYWIVFNATTDDGITYSTQTGGERVWRASNYSNGLPAAAGTTGWTRSGAMDCTHVLGVAIQGYAKASRVQLTGGTVAAQSLAFYTHQAGTFRLAIYGDNAGPAGRLWESGVVAAAADAWITVYIGVGSPPSLNLGLGTYWLAWQWDSPAPGPSYLAGTSGDGYQVPLPWGPFPATWPGGAASAETWSVTLTTRQYLEPPGW